MSDQSLALRRHEAPSAEALGQMLAVAEKLVKERMVPVAVKTAGQALALMLTGQELGIGPLRSVQDLYFVKGNIGITTKLMVAFFRREGHYHDIISKTADHCKVVLHLKEGRAVTTEFTRDEVDALGYPYYWKKNERGQNTRYMKPLWKSDPVLMLYNRTMTKGIRTNAPDVLYGLPTKDELQDQQFAVLSPEREVSLDAFLEEYYPEVLEDYLRGDKPPPPARTEQGQVVDGESREIPPGGDNGDEGPDPDGTPALSRPYQPAHRKRLVQAEAAKGAQTLANSRRTGPLCGWLDALFPTDSKDAKTQQRYTLLRFFFDKDSSKKLTDGEVTALAKWVTVKEAGAYVVDGMSVTEAHMILRACVEAKGQQSLLDPPQQEQAGMQEILHQEEIPF